MCVTCGCSGSEHFHAPLHNDGHNHQHLGGTTRLVDVEQAVLAQNDAYAATNRELLSSRGISAFNLLSSPGSGKTTLLVNTIVALRDRYPIAVIEGDQQTDQDAQRVRSTGVAAIQINTGKGCHLDAHQVAHGIADLELADNSLLFIENVGNLVCPAEFDLGEDSKVVILSVTEGEEKPLKYPNMFHAADVILLNKIDLLPYVSFDIDKCRSYIERVNARAPLLLVSATRADGMEAWLRWIEANHGVKMLAQRPPRSDQANTLP